MKKKYVVWGLLAGTFALNASDEFKDAAVSQSSLDGSVVTQPSVNRGENTQTSCTACLERTGQTLESACSSFLDCFFGSPVPSE